MRLCRLTRIIATRAYLAKLPPGCPVVAEAKGQPQPNKPSIDRWPKLRRMIFNFQFPGRSNTLLQGVEPRDLELRFRLVTNSATHDLCRHIV